VVLYERFYLNFLDLTFLNPVSHIHVHVITYLPLATKNSVVLCFIKKSVT